MVHADFKEVAANILALLDAVEERKQVDRPWGQPPVISLVCRTRRTAC